MAKVIYGCPNCGHKTVSKSFNFLVFVLWIILFFPVAIWYAIVRNKKPVCKSCGTEL